jgi:cysteine desulfurase
VAEIAELCRERGVWFHLDATHVLGKMPFDLDEIAPDFLSFNGDHIHAPVGTGALFVRSGLRPPSLIVGGKDQDGLRGGSVSAALLVALGVAAAEAHERREQVAMEGARLRAKLEGCGQVLFSGGLPTTACLAFPGVASDALLYRLAQKQLYASFGGGNCQQLSLQLAAAGVEPPLTECAVSFSLSHETTESDIDRAVALIDETVAELRKMSEALV